MKKKVSLKDIAQKVGVSTALVSYVLNNKKVGRISLQITEKIKEAAKELNYSGNFIAKSLKTKKTFTLGLIVADISNAFWSSLARIIEDEAEKNNYTVLFGSSDEKSEKSEKLIKVFQDHQVDGLILAPTEGSEKQLTLLHENDTPFVLIDRYFPGMNVSHVAIDNYNASFRLVQHVIDEGFKRIGLVIFKSSLFHLHERQRGYTACLKENKIAFTKNHIKEVGLESADAEVAKAIDVLLGLPKPVEVILFATNELSRLGLKHLISRKVKVPEEVAIISFDQSESADLFYSPITYVKQPLKEMGELAIKMLLENIKNNKVEQVNLAGELIVQQSSLRKHIGNA